MTNVRYQLTADVYMPLDGQWSQVGKGTVFDDSPSVNYHSMHVTQLSPGEPAGSLGSTGRATSVRNVSRR